MLTIWAVLAASLWQDTVYAEAFVASGIEPAEQATGQENQDNQEDDLVNQADEQVIKDAGSGAESTLSEVIPDQNSVQIYDIPFSITETGHNCQFPDNKHMAGRLSG